MTDQNHPGIHSLADLHRERAVLRSKISHQEEVLKDHYSSFAKRISPVLRIANFVSGNRLFKNTLSESGEEGTGGGDLLSMLLKLLVAGTAGGFLFKKTKKSLVKSAMALAIDKGIQFLQEKDISVYIEKLKEWLAKRKEGKEEDKSE